jgi:hypothetical protein
MRQSIGKDSYEWFILRLTVYPFKSILMNKITGILLSVFIVLRTGSDILMLNILL